jgi:Flp pilus assembly protein TadG
MYAKLGRAAIMLGRIAQKASNFRRDDRGVVLVLFAVLLMPFLILMAIAIDLSQFLVMKQQLTVAVDAAVLNLGKQPDLSDDDAKAQTEAFIAANYPAIGSIGAVISIDPPVRTKETVVVTAKASMNTSFLKIAGYDTLTVTVNSTAAIKENKIEVVLVLDNTGSMADAAGGSTKIEGLKTAATELTNILFGGNDTSEYVKIGVVPFTAAVNVGSKYAGASWIDNAGVTALTRENLTLQNGQTLFTLFGELRNASWRGCVRQRKEPYDISETPPTTNAAILPDTLFTPYFAPDEPDSTYVLNGRRYNYANNYLTDHATGDLLSIQHSTPKYSGGTVPGNSDGPNYLCPVKAILRLTDQRQAVLDEIDGMSPKGNTVIPAGLMWGWHLISPNFWPFATVDAKDKPVPAPYEDEETIKAIVLVTDGDNNVSSGSNGFNKSYFSAYGYAGEGGHLTIYTSLTPEGNLDKKLLNLCGNIKAIKNSKNKDRIILYMIALGDDINSNSKKMLQQCATDSTTYFTTSTTEDLIATFQKIAVGLNELRISR